MCEDVRILRISRGRMHIPSSCPCPLASVSPQVAGWPHTTPIFGKCTTSFLGRGYGRQRPCPLEAKSWGYKLLPTAPPAPSTTSLPLRRWWEAENSQTGWVPVSPEKFTLLEPSPHSLGWDMESVSKTLQAVLRHSPGGGLNPQSSSLTGYVALGNPGPPLPHQRI